MRPSRFWVEIRGLQDGPGPGGTGSGTGTKFCILPGPGPGLKFYFCRDRDQYFQAGPGSFFYQKLGWIIYFDVYYFFMIRDLKNSNFTIFINFRNVLELPLKIEILSLVILYFDRLNIVQSVTLIQDYS